jgi:hypothetical protein
VSPFFPGRRTSQTSAPFAGRPFLQSGFQLDIPRMFAALFLVTLAGVGLFVIMAGLSRLTLGDWHESEIGAHT